MTRANLVTEEAGLPASMRPVYCRGWSEALLGIGYPREFDAWQIDRQLYYEYGRLEACNVAAAGLPRVLLKRADFRSVALALTLSIAAEERIGLAIPPEADAA